tara:strand:- start:1905 stop:2915 length:1011 start_codon:yes stop_codon:yes gene_type:complete
MSKEQTEKTENLEEKNQDVSVDSNKEFYSGYSPLDEPVTQRDYTTPNIDASNLEDELEEPVFNAPNFDDFDTEPQEPNSFNPAIDNLDKKEQMYATEQMVDTVLDVYDKAHILANRTVKLKEEKIAEAMEQGEISPSLEVPIDERGNTLGLLQYVQEYNRTLDDAIKLEDEFIEKVRPPMIRVFQKRGLAMTDEQFLAVAFGTDILTKGAMVFQLVKQNNKLMKMWKEQSSNTPPAPPSPTQTTSSAPPEPEPSIVKPEPTSSPVYQEPEEFTAQSMVDEMVGGDTNFQNSQSKNDNMPQFGDPEILKEIEKIAKKEESVSIAKPKRKRGRPKKNK